MPQPVPGGLGAIQAMLLVHLGVFVLLVVGVEIYGLTRFTPEDLLTPVSIVFFLLSTWMLWSWKQARGSMFNMYGLFIWATIPFHGGYAALRVLGFEEQIYMLSAFGPAEMLATTTFIILGMAGMHLGALAAIGLRQYTTPITEPIQQDGSTRSIYLVGGALLLISLGPTLLQLKDSLQTVLASGYVGLFQNRSDPSSAGGALFVILRAFFLPSIMFVVTASQHRKLGQIAAAGAIAFNTFAFMVLGFRAYAMLPVLAFVWIWHHRVRRLPIKAIMLTGFLAFLLLAPAIRYTRELSGNERMSLATLVEAYTSKENPMISLVAELGSSMFTVSYTMEYVPEARSYDWGAGYLRAVLNAVPIADMPYAYDQYDSHDAWISWTAKPEWAVRGWGFGYSYIAEAYLNFGWWGGPLILLLIGFLLVRFQLWAEGSCDPAKLSILAAFMPMLFFFSRGETMSLVRPLVWYILFPYLAILILRHVYQRIGVVDRVGAEASA